MLIMMKYDIKMLNPFPVRTSCTKPHDGSIGGFGFGVVKAMAQAHGD